MKIGILTFHRSINYGAFMQAYALSNAIRQRYGNIVEIIDFEKLSKHKMYASPSHGIKNLLLFGNEQRCKYKRFQEDLQLLPLSDKTLITDNYEDVFDYINGRYDLIIVGSDAVWAYNKHLGLKNPYWLFGDKLKCKKMSYAASAYSLDISKISQKEKDYISECLNSFSYIGVRDKETFNLVKSCNPSLEVNYNCDPTVLLPQPDQKKAAAFLEEKFNIDDHKKIISFMVHSSNNIFQTIIKKLGKQDYTYVCLYNRLQKKDRIRPWTPTYLYDLSPYEWYQCYSCFYLNITNYFHGTLLALRSGVPTLSFDVTHFKYDYTSKIRQLLSDLNLVDFWFDDNIRTSETENKVIEKVLFTIEHHDIISKQIEIMMSNEKKKSESFFSALDKELYCESN